MAVTITNVVDTPGGGSTSQARFAGSTPAVKRYFTVVLDDSYPDNGESLSAISGKFSSVINMTFSPSGTYLWEYDYTNNKIIAYSKFSGVSEIQTLTLADGATAGTWTATYAGQTTATIARNASAAAMQAAIKALSNVDPEGVSEVQTVTLSDFSGTDSFKLTQNATETIAFVRGTNATAAAIQAEIRSVWGDAGALVTGTTDAGPFVVTFVTDIDEGAITVTSGVGCTGSVVETTAGVPALSVVRSGAGTQASPYVYTITGGAGLSGENLAQITGTGTGLTASTLTIATTTDGTGIKELQTLTLTAGVADNTFKLTFNANQSTATVTIPPGGYAAVTKAQIATCLATISDFTGLNILSVADGTVPDILVGGAAGGPFTIEFSKTLVGNIGAITVTSKVGAADGSVAETTAGSAGVSEVQTITLTDGPTAGTWAITHAGQTTSALASNESAAAASAAMVALSNVTGSGIASDEVVVTRSGAGTQASPYIYTLTWRADSGNVAQPTATGTALLGSTVTAATTTQGSEVAAGTDLSAVTVRVEAVGFAP